MDFIYLLMNCVVTASIIVITGSALWSILVLLMTDSSDRHSRLYVITHTIGAITLMLFGIKFLVGWLK
jgi:hypothetical protein